MELIIGGAAGALAVLLVIVLGSLYMRNKIAPVSYPTGDESREDAETATNAQTTEE